MAKPLVTDALWERIQPLLPPPNDQYISPAQWHALYAQGIIIRDVRHKLFTDSFQPPQVGASATHSFNSTIDLQVSTDGGANWVSRSSGYNFTDITFFEGTATPEPSMLVLAGAFVIPLLLRRRRSGR